MRHLSGVCFVMIDTVQMSVMCEDDSISGLLFVSFLAVTSARTDANRR